jgi:hypothetical protein
MATNQTGDGPVVTTLTDDWSTASDDGEDMATDMVRRPAPDHPAVADIPVEELALSHPLDGWRGIPHPDEIESLIEEDVCTEGTTTPSHVREAIDEITDDPTPEQYLVMDASDVYEYLYEIQRKNDLHFENFHRRQVIVNQLSNGRRNGKPTKASTYDKRWLTTWEAKRRLALRSFDEWKEYHLDKSQDGLR